MRKNKEERKLKRIAKKALAKKQKQEWLEEEKKWYDKQRKELKRIAEEEEHNKFMVRHQKWVDQLSPESIARMIRRSEAKSHKEFIIKEAIAFKEKMEKQNKIK